MENILCKWRNNNNNTQQRQIENLKKKHTLARLLARTHTNATRIECAKVEKRQKCQEREKNGVESDRAHIWRVKESQTRSNGVLMCMN